MNVFQYKPNQPTNSNQPIKMTQPQIGWDHNRTLDLIESYKNKPELWDIRDNNYHLRNKKQDAWVNISLQFDTDVEGIKNKMASLLSSFRRERGKMRKQCNGVTTYGKSNWFAFKHFKFLLEKGETNGTRRYKSEAPDYESDPEYTEPEIVNTDGSLFTFDPPENGVETAESAYSTRTGGVSTKRKHEQYDQEETDDADYIYIKKPSKKDESAIFSKHIAMKLRQFSDTSRKVVMHRINNAIFEEETKEFNIVNYG